LIADILKKIRTPGLVRFGTFDVCINTRHFGITTHV